MGEGNPETASSQLAGFAPGGRVAGYLIEEQVGAGGMAVVFRAVDGRLGRRVALKVLAPALAHDRAFRERFIRESRAAAAVDDPHIIPVHEAGEAGGILFIAMRLVPGRDARTLLQEEGPLPPGRAATIVSQVASALDAAHATGLVHRDVKPANILLHERPGRPDHVYLADFGLTKDALSPSLTASGLFLGTPSYTAPEQIQGRAVDGRADQYALACTAFELLAGVPPFERDQGTAVIWAHLYERPPAVRAKRPDLPDAVDVVVARALSKSPQDRYPSCAAFADALGAALEFAPQDAVPHATPKPRTATVIAAPMAPPPSAPPSAGSADQGMDSGQGPVTVTSARYVPARPALLPGEGAGNPDPDSRAITTVAFAPAGATFAVGSVDGRTSIYQAVSMAISANLASVPAGTGTEGHAVEAVAYSPDGSLLAVGSADGRVRFWDTRGPRPAGSLIHPDSAGISSVAFHPDGTLLAAADENGSVYLWDIRTEHLVGELAIPASAGVLSVEFSPDGTKLATCDGNGSAYLWDHNTRRLLTSLTRNGPGGMLCAAFTADSSLLATGDGDGTIWLWDTDSGTQLGTLARRRSRRGTVFAVAFSPHSFETADLAAGYASGEICLWNAERSSRRPVTTLGTGQDGAAYAVAFSPDGHKLAAGYARGHAAVWDIATRHRTVIHVSPNRTDP